MPSIEDSYPLRNYIKPLKQPSKLKIVFSISAAALILPIQFQLGMLLDVHGLKGYKCSVALYVISMPTFQFDFPCCYGSLAKYIINEARFKITKLEYAFRSLIYFTLKYFKSFRSQNFTSIR